MKKIALIIYLLLFYNYIRAQNNILESKLIDKAIIIDGRIDSIWGYANTITLNYQLEPDNKTLPSEITQVKVLQHQNNLYFLFLCKTNKHKKVIASIQERDKLNLNDDIISLLLDTYNDNHSAVLFQVNPLSTMADAKITRDGKSVNYLWDTEWTAKSEIYDDYWVAELCIPLTSLRFESNTKLWGCNFSRSIKANQEIDWWQKTSENYRVSQSGKLIGMQLNAKKKHEISLFPYATLRYEDSDMTNKHNSFEADGGLDVKYSYKSNINVNLTYNPDFATVEGDKEEINLTPWEIKFPEKRLFFQDGNEMFDTRIRTFYSRRIGDIIAGGKVNGKIGKNQFNGLYARTEKNTSFDIPAAHFTAFRFKRDILKSSTLGLTYTNKLSDTAKFHVVSLDYVLNLGDKWKLTGQFVGSAVKDFYPHSAWFVRFAKENNVFHYHLRYTEIGDKFKENVNETGFIYDDDRRELDCDVSYRFWLNNKIKYISVFGRNNVFWSQKNVLRSWYITYGSRIYLNNKFSLDLRYNNEYKNSYKEVNDNFYNHYYKATLGYNTDANKYLWFSYQQGINFKRQYQLLGANSSVQLLKKLSLNYELKFLKFEDKYKNANTTINVVGISYYHTKNIWLRVFAQHNSHNQRIYLYSLMGWRFKPPFGAVYLIFSSDEYEEILRPEKLRYKVLFLKFTYPINFKL